MPPVSCQEQDFLEQDAPVRGQNYACVSFLSPEDAIASKDAFTVSRFLNAFAKEANEVLTHAEEKLGTVENDDEEARKENKQVLANLRERYSYLFDEQKLLEEFDKYKSSYSVQLQEDYAAAHDHQCSIRGIKIRGVYETLKEAQARAQHLKRMDPAFSVYVCEVGCWCPWSPDPEEIKDAEYSETQLNSLMKKYKENMVLKDEMYELRKRELMQDKAKEAEGEADGEVVGSEASSSGAFIESTEVATVSQISEALEASV